MLSDAYQQSHEVDPENLKLDPENRYLWHFRPRRLEAETIRDALLAVGGNLDPHDVRSERARQHAAAERLPAGEAERADSDHDDVRRPRADAEHRRAERHHRADAGAGDDELAVRAAAGREAVRPHQAGRRTRRSQRRSTAATGSPSAARRPTRSERRMLAFVDQQRAAMGGDSPETTDKALVEFCHVLLCLNEFVYVD